jgi:hypothetical protein
MQKRRMTMGTTINDINNASEEAVEKVMGHLDEILGDTYKLEGIHIQVSKQDGRMLNFTLNDERLKDLLYVLTSQIICITFRILRDDLHAIKDADPKPYKPSALTGRTNVGLATSDLRRIEARVLAKVDEKLTGMLASLQMSSSKTEVDPKDYNKHLFGKRNA